MNGPEGIAQPAMRKLTPLENDVYCDTTDPYDDATADCDPFDEVDDLEDEWWEELCTS